MYSYIFPNGIKVKARQYKNNLLPLFIPYIDGHWIPTQAERYFKLRDPITLKNACQKY